MPAFTGHTTAQGLTVTSGQTPVDWNAEQAVRAHNQAMSGEPIHDIGLYPTETSKKLNEIYYQDVLNTGRKQTTFQGNLRAPFQPDQPELARGVTNDIWNMRAGEYPGKEGKAYSGTPTPAQYDFMEREVAGPLTERLNQTSNTPTPWLPMEAQASLWAATKARADGTTVGEAGFNFADAFDRLYAQQSFETIPGRQTGHLPEMFNADPRLFEEYHQDILGAITDPQGRDLINLHLGLLTGRTFTGPGIFENQIHPGAQALAAVSAAKGSGVTSIDPASTALLNAAELTRSLVLTQDAGAWNRSFARASGPAGEKNLMHLDLGHTLTDEEAAALQKAISARAGGAAADMPLLPSQTGARIINVSDLDNLTFQRHITQAVTCLRPG